MTDSSTAPSAADMAIMQQKLEARSGFPLPGAFREVDCWELLRLAIPHARRILIWGPPGTGKTYTAAKEAMPEGRYAYQITMTEETPATDLVGRYTIKNDGKGGVEMVWQDGPAIMAWRDGRRLVINEIDLGGPDVKSILHVLLDDPDFATLTLPTGETVRPSAGFQVIATMNGVPEALRPALRDRFPVTVFADRIHPGALDCLPPFLRVMAQKSALAPDKERRVSIRAWLEFARLANKMGVVEAATACFGKRAPELADAVATALAAERQK